MSAVMGALAALMLVLMLINVFYDVIMRYFFNDVSIGMQELEWHLFSALFLLGVSYGISTQGHVRVDLFHERLPERARLIVEIVGFLFFLLPFTVVVAYYGIHFSLESFTLDERSADPGGLSHRWIIKAMIPLSFFMMSCSGFGEVLRCLRCWCALSHLKNVDITAEHHG